MSLNNVGGSSFADAVAKSIYSEDAEDATFKDKPGLGIASKDESFGGKDVPYPIKYGKPTGASVDFATAQANASNSTWAQFLLQSCEQHQVVQLTSRQIAALNSDEKGFVKLLRDEMQSAMQNLSQKLETQFTRDGSMNIGQIASSETVSGTDITLATAASIVNFEVGQRLVFSATATNTGGLRSNGDAAAVTAISLPTYTLSFAAGLSTTVAAVAASDYIFEEGDVSVAGVSGGDYQGVRGLAAWFPATAPSSGESFMGLDRSPSSRLYGFYTNASTTTSTFQEALVDGAGNIAQYHGAGIDTATMASADYRRLRKEAVLDTQMVKGTGFKGGSEVGYGYEGVKIQGDKGPFTVLGLFKQAAGTAYLLKKETLELKSMGPLVRWDDTDGNTILRRSSASGIEGRLVSWSQLACYRPGDNGSVLLPS